MAAKMTKPQPQDAAPSAATAPALCAQCYKPPALCICAAVQPIDNRVFVLILQHPQEQDKLLGTARLTELAFSRSRLAIGLSWPSLKKLLGHDADPKRWGTLYLGTAKAAAAAAPAAGGENTVLAVNAKGVPLQDQAGVLASLDGIILLDGNWSQAKALWWRNPWLLKTRRLILNPPASSLYGALRREPRRESLSTLESAAYCLARLEHRDDLIAPALAPFKHLLANYRG